MIPLTLGHALAIAAVVSIAVAGGSGGSHRQLETAGRLDPGCDRRLAQTSSRTAATARSISSIEL